MKRSIFLFILIMILPSPGSRAQDYPYRLQSPLAGHIGCSFTSWWAGGDRITEIACPFSVIYPVSSRLQLYTVSGPAFTNLRAGQTYTLAGMSDIKLGGHFLFAGDAWLLTFGLNLPAGRSRLTPDEYTVATVACRSAFGLRVPSYGEGLDVQAGLSNAYEVGAFRLGWGLSYLFKGSFAPFTTAETRYNPGDEVTITLAVNRGGFFFDLVYTLFFTDTWGGNDVLRAGPSLLAQSMFSLNTGDWQLVFFLRDQLRARNKIVQGGLLETERKNRNGNELDLQAAGWRDLERGARLKTFLYIKFYSNNDFGNGGLFQAGPGIGLEWPLSEPVSFSGELKAGLGSYQAPSGRVSLSGLSGYGGIIIRL